jgi:hypothetical protein
MDKITSLGFDFIYYFKKRAWKAGIEAQNHLKFQQLHSLKYSSSNDGFTQNSQP